MDLAFLQDLNIPPWAPVLAAFIFGAIFGWLIKGLPESDDEDVSVRDRVREKAAFVESDELDGNNHVKGNLEVEEEGKSFLPIEREAPNGMKLAALESELRKMQELVGDQEAEQNETNNHLVEIDTALKRANGRLKLIIGAVKKAASRR